MNWCYLFFFIQAISETQIPEEYDVKKAHGTFETSFGQKSEIVEYCMIDDHPYTIRLVVSMADTMTVADCTNPWRTQGWICNENRESCDDFQTFNLKNSLKEVVK
jgi:hypothetical protein